MKTSLMILCVLLLTSVFGNTEDQRMEEKQDLVQLLYSQTHDLASVDLSCESVDDCDSMAYGDRACGGPAGYLVYSKNNPVLSLLEESAKTSSRVHRELNQEFGLFSICALAPRPRVKCIENKCQ